MSCLDELLVHKAMASSPSSKQDGVCDIQWQFQKSVSTQYNDSIGVVDLTTLGSTPDYFDWSQAYLRIPCQLKATVDVTTANSAGVARISWKPMGAFGLIDSLQVVCNGRTLSENSNLNSVYRHLVHMFTWDRDFLNSVAGTYMMGKQHEYDALNSRFAPGTGGTTALTTFRSNDLLNDIGSGSIVASTTLTATSVGPSPPAGTYVVPPDTLITTSDVVITDVATTVSGVLSSGPDLSDQYIGSGQANAPLNYRLYESIVHMLYPSASSGGSSVANAYAIAAGKNYFSVDGTTSITYTVWATLPLKYIHDVFDQIGVARGLAMKITLFLNQCVGSTGTVVAGSTGLTSTSGCWSRNFCPITVVNSNLTMPTDNLLKIGDIANSGTNSIECWLPRVIFSGPQLEKLKNISRTIRYKDYLQNVKLDQATGAGSSVIWQLMSGLHSPKKIYIMGFPTGSVLRITDTGANTDRGWLGQASSFEPAMSSVGFCLDDIQMVVNSTPVNSLQISQADRQFTENTIVAYALNAGQVGQLSSGLYSKVLFDSCPIYVFDLTRQSLGNQSVSLTLRATNKSIWNTDLLAFVEIEKEFTITSDSNGTTLGPVINV